jgi:hypothetical protein
MPAFTTIADTAIAEGKPVRAIDTRALRDNPLAIAEGNDTAPTVKPWALSGHTVTAGSTLVFKNHFEHVSFEQNSEEWCFAFHAQIFASGTVTMKCQHKSNAIGDSFESRMGFFRLRNSGTSTLGTWTRSSNGSWSTRSVNVSVLPGDCLAVGHYRDTASKSTARDFEILTGGEYPLIFGFGGLVFPTRATGA